MRSLVSTSSVFYLPREDYEAYQEYKNEFKKVIKEREQSRIVFLHQSPQISFRDSLIQYVRKVCSSKSLSQSCLHLAVYLLDMFMDNHHIVPERLLLVANVCLLLSAKLEENALKIPKISELNTFISNGYSTIDYTNLEILIFRFFRFHIKFPCAVHYIYYYMQEFITCDDLNNDRSFRSLFYDICEFITTYLDHIIEDVHYMQYYKPSKLAAAVIAASRFDAGLTPWTKQLADLTEYQEEELNEIVRNLRKKSVLRCSQCVNHENNTYEKI